MDSDFFQSVFHYARLSKIRLDKQEFLLNVSSHPVPSTVLAIVDTLDLQGIKTEAYRVDFSHLNDLPQAFLTVLTVDNEELIHAVEKRSDGTFRIVSSVGKSNVGPDHLEAVWTGVVVSFAAEQLPSSGLPLRFTIPGWIIVMLAGMGSTIVSGQWLQLSYVATTIAGLLLSVSAFMQSKGVKSAVSKYCDGSGQFDCSIITSEKGLFGGRVSFTDLAVVYFSTQFIVEVCLMYSGDYMVLATLQKYIGLAVLPVIAFSLYQQAAGRKWCLICLGILLVLVLQLLFAVLLAGESTTLGLSTLVFIVFAGVLVVMSYSSIKKAEKRIEAVRSDLIPAMKVVRSFDTFSKKLTRYEPFQFPKERITVGKKDARLCISLVTNPYCSGCQELHGIVNKLQKRLPDDLRVDIYFKTNMSLEPPEVIRFFQMLYSVYINSGAEKFDLALEKWFELDNDKAWFLRFGDQTADPDFLHYYDAVNQWCLDQQIDLTPVMFINGFLYPTDYDIQFLPYFINDLLEFDFGREPLTKEMQYAAH